MLEASVSGSGSVVAGGGWVVTTSVPAPKSWTTSAVGAAIAILCGALASIAVHYAVLADNMASVLVPLLAFGIACLPSIAFMKPNGFWYTVGTGSIVQFVVIIAATLTSSVLESASAGKMLPYFLFIGYAEFIVVAVPVIVLARSIFWA